MILLVPRGPGRANLRAQMMRFGVQLGLGIEAEGPKWATVAGDDDVR